MSTFKIRYTPMVFPKLVALRKKRSFLFLFEKITSLFLFLFEKITSLFLFLFEKTCIIDFIHNDNFIYCLLFIGFSAASVYYLVDFLTTLEAYKKSVKLAFASSTIRGCRIALYIRTDNAKPTPNIKYTLVLHS